MTARFVAPGVALSSLLGLLSACGSDPSEADGAGASSAGGSGSGGATECPDEGSSATAAVCVTDVTGVLVDEQDEPLADLIVSVCGEVSCSPGESDPSGAFEVVVNRFITPDEFAVLPHGREQDLAPFYFPLPAAATGPAVDVGQLPVLSMPADGPTLVVRTDQAGAPAQTVTSAGVTLEVAEGVEVQLAFDDVALGAAGKQFRAREVPPAARDRYVDSALGVEALWALYPFESSFRPEGSPADLAQARLSFPNTLGLQAGDAVEVLALGSFSFPDWIAPARFSTVATATVTADRQRIEMDSGEGIPHLTWIAIRAAR
ncbi:MAG: hypothetical protein JRI23_19330 [Deltaproteobacteria bacterium]|jgi:hypothetical protein|nr:hypothetical protein [Deltaproteobacteria bacterium]MBW2534017.1 hypothetical protein [Deltaproteobacteria bacterium]